MRKALVLGATGLVGGHLTDLLLNSPQYSEVHLVTRRPTAWGEQPKVTEHLLDFEKLPDSLVPFAINDLFCCLGTTIKKAGSQKAFRRVDLEYPLLIAELFKRHVEHFSCVTALGADSDSSIFYNRVKGELEEALRQFGFPYLSLFRPSLLLGERDEHRLLEELGTRAGRVLRNLMVGPMRQFRPIEARKVAVAMLEESLKLERASRKERIIVVSSESMSE